MDRQIFYTEVTSYDFNPISEEQLAQAQQEVIAAGGVDKVYWGKYSKKYHVDPDCPAFSQSETVYEGTVGLSAADRTKG